MRKAMVLFGARPVFSPGIFSWMLIAARRARTALGNSARMPSPISLKMRPRKSSMLGRITSRRASSITASVPDPGEANDIGDQNGRQFPLWFVVLHWISAPLGANLERLANAVPPANAHVVSYAMGAAMGKTIA